MTASKVSIWRDDYLVKPFEVRELLAVYVLFSPARRRRKPDPYEWHLDLDPAASRSRMMVRRAAHRTGILAFARAHAASRYDPVAGRSGASYIRMERGGGEQRRGVSDTCHSQKIGSRRSAMSEGWLDGRPPFMTTSLGARLVIGLTALVLATALRRESGRSVGPMTRPSKSDSLLLQVGALLSARTSRTASRLSMGRQDAQIGR